MSSRSDDAPPTTADSPAGRADPLAELARRAVRGDARSLRALVEAIQHDLYGLALRMTWHPEDAEDATQEALTRIVTSLGSFEGRSAFRTWAFRIGVRSVLDARRGRAEVPLSFEAFAADLAQGLDVAARPAETPERALLEREVRIGCTHAMLLCLDRDHRVAYLLGEVLGFSGDEASEVLEIEPAAFRKRLSRARERVESFVRRQCGLASEAAPCRCHRRLRPALETGRVDPRRLLFAPAPLAAVSPAEIAGVVGEIGRLCSAAELLRGNGRFLAPARLIERLLASG